MQIQPTPTDKGVTESFNNLKSNLGTYIKQKLSYIGSISRNSTGDIEKTKRNSQKMSSEALPKNIKFADVCKSVKLLTEAIFNEATHKASNAFHKTVDSTSSRTEDKDYVINLAVQTADVTPHSRTPNYNVTYKNGSNVDKAQLIDTKLLEIDRSINPLEQMVAFDRYGGVQFSDKNAALMIKKDDNGFYIQVNPKNTKNLDIQLNNQFIDSAPENKIYLSKGEHSINIGGQQILNFTL